MEKSPKNPDKVTESKEKLSISLIDDLFETAVFKSTADEELSLEVKKLLESF